MTDSTLSADAESAGPWAASRAGSPGPYRVRGIINTNKPTGVTSYDVIRRLKQNLRPVLSRIGHAGTLDPFASGVLLILVNEATKLSRLVMNTDKEYEAEVLFGTGTDTDDITGTVIHRSPVPDMSERDIAGLLARFTGSFEQQPPRYSAIKQDGIPLHRLARRGQHVEPVPRPVTVHRLELLEWNPPRLRLRATVSSGTYVRSLARDIGDAAGTCATTSALVRTRSGTFSAAESLPPEQVTIERLAGFIVPVERAVPAAVPRVELDVDSCRRLRQGQSVRRNGGPVGQALAHTSDHTFLALVSSDGRILRPVRIVYADFPD